MYNSNNIELKPSLLDTAFDNSNKAKIKLLNHKIKLNYFKDRFGSEPDQNEDTKKKRNYIICDYVPQCKSEWTLIYREKIKKKTSFSSLCVVSRLFY
jgi:hypothetical protein